MYLNALSLCCTERTGPKRSTSAAATAEAGRGTAQADRQQQPAGMTSDTESADCEGDLHDGIVL